MREVDRTACPAAQFLLQFMYVFDLINRIKKCQIRPDELAHRNRMMPNQVTDTLVECEVFLKLICAWVQLQKGIFQTELSSAFITSFHMVLNVFVVLNTVSIGRQ